MFRYFISSLWVILAAVACDVGIEPGRFGMSFQWEEQPTESVWIWLRVEQRVDPQVPEGIILAQAGPEEYKPGGDAFSMTLGGVEHGDNLVLVVEVREADNSGLPVRYFGLSDSFSLHAGDDKTVSVSLSLKEPEVSKHAGSVELLFSGSVATTVNATEIKSATIRTRTVGAVSMVISNDPSWTANYTAVSLTGDVMACHEEADEESTWRVCELTGWDMTAGLLSTVDGLYTVYVKFMDQPGNASAVHKAGVVLDSQPPAILIASISPEVAPAGATVVLSMTLQEALGSGAGDAVLAIAPATQDSPVFAGPQRVGISNSYFWTATIDAEHSEEGAVYDFSIGMTDAMGNRVEGVPVIDQDGNPVRLGVDAVAPRLVAPEGIGLSQALFGLSAGAADQHLSFDFTMEDVNAPMLPELCDDLCPVVRLGTSIIGTVVRDLAADEPEHHRYGFHFDYAVTAADWPDIDKEMTISVVWSDQAGNQGDDTLAETVRLDFIRPAADCIVSPKLAGLGDIVTIIVEPTEAILPGGITADSTISFILPELGGPLVFSHTVVGEDAGVTSWSFDLQLLDMAGNEASGGLACAVDGVIDAVAPQLLHGIAETDPPVENSSGQTVLAVGPEDSVLTTLTIQEDQGLESEGLEVTLDVPGAPLALELLSLEEAAVGQYIATFGAELDFLDHSDLEGYWPLRVVLTDLAGNQTLVPSLNNALVAVDFTPPTAKCILVPDSDGTPAGIGKELLVQVSPLEELAPGALPVLVEAFEPVLASPYFELVDGSSYQFIAAVEPGDGERSFSVSAQLTDLVGNATPPVGNACLDGPLTGAIDGKAPVVAQLQLLPSDGVPLRSGNEVVADMVVENTPLLPQVSVGGGALEPTSAEPSPVVGGFSWTFTRTLDGSEAQGEAILQVSGQDEAGNGYTYSHAEHPLVFDFTPPALVGTPFIERCDYLPTARLAANDIMVGAAMDCQFPQDGCEAVGAVRVGFFLSEEVAPDSISASVQGLPMAVCHDGGYPAYLFYTPTGIETENSWTPGEPYDPGDKCGNTVVQAADLAGNPVELGLGCLRFDRTAPAAPATTVDGRIVYRRVPWGAAETGGQPTFSLTGDAGSVEPYSAVKVYADAALGLELDRSEAGADGAFDGLQWNGDRPRVYVTATDAAGNESDADDDPGNGLTGTLVRDVEWVSTLGGKVAGSIWENPHEFDTRSWFLDRYHQGDAAVPADVADLGGDSGAPVETGGEGDWVRRRLLNTAPPGRLDAPAMAYDSARDRIVLFGGRAPDDALSDQTWEFDGRNWEQRQPVDLLGDGNPSIRRWPAMAYDSRRQRVVLFGGVYAQGAYAEGTWEWDGWEWRRMETGDTAPPLRWEHAMAYDVKRHRVVLYGGITSKVCPTCHDPDEDVWEWDGAGWTTVGVENIPPSRCSHSMVYDPVGERLVLFGGFAPDGTILSDTWGLSADGWTMLSVQGPMEPRVAASMVFDGKAGEIVLFGGEVERNPDDKRFFDTWLWDGAEWTSAQAGPEPPPAAARAPAVWDEARERVVMYGGVLAGGELSDGTREWGEEGWQLCPGVDDDGDGAPTIAAHQAMAYDKSRGKTVLYGPYEPGMWEWDGTQWAQVHPDTYPDPALLDGFVMAYDESRSRIVMVGADYFQGEPLPKPDTVWEWDGENWYGIVPADGEGPGALGYPGLAWNPAAGSGSGRIQLFGGFQDIQAPTGDLWEWDGAKWTQQGPDGPDAFWPAPRGDLAMAWDGQRMQVLGGRSTEQYSAVVSDFQWEWHNGTWSESALLPGAPSPPLRTRHSAVFDSLRERVLLFGGCNHALGAEPLGDLWEWNGDSWRRLTPADPLGDGSPGVRELPNLVYDSQRDRAVLFGGKWGATGDPHPHWEWDSGPDFGPGQVARFSFAAAGPGSDFEVKEVGTTWVTGGTGWPDGDETAGVRLLVWDFGHFEQVATATGSAQWPELTAWSSTDPATLARLFAGKAKVLTFAATTAAPNGLGRAVLTTGYASCFVRYRIFE